MGRSKENIDLEQIVTTANLHIRFFINLIIVMLGCCFILILINMFPIYTPSMLGKRED